MYRLIGDTHTLAGLLHSTSEFLRFMDSMRHTQALAAGVSTTELRAMSCVAENDTVTPKALAEFLQLSTPAVTAITSNLVARGLLARVEHPQDRRSLLLRLTPSGHDLMQATYCSFQEAIGRAAAQLGDRRGELESLVEIFVGALTGERDGLAAH